MLAPSPGSRWPRDWDTSRMVFGAAALSLSFGCFFINAITAARWPTFRTIPQAYTTVALVFLAPAKRWAWSMPSDSMDRGFLVTQGRLGGHAHLGLLGWLALTLMGVSYQLVPMFEVVRRGMRRAWPALAITAAATAVGAPLLMTDPDPTVRFTIAVAFAAGPLLWLVDTARLLRPLAAQAGHPLPRHLRLSRLPSRRDCGRDRRCDGRECSTRRRGSAIAARVWGAPSAVGRRDVYRELFQDRPSSSGMRGTLAGHVRVPLLAASRTPASHMPSLSSMRSPSSSWLAALAGSLSAVHAGGWLLAVTGVTHAALASVLTRHPSREAVSAAAAAARPGTVLP